MPFGFPHRTPVYTTTEIRRLEALALTLPERPQLMERAGLAAAQCARESVTDTGKPILILAGPGNNGGDAFVIARHLRQWWFKVIVVFTGSEENLSDDARAALAAWRAAGGDTLTALPQQRNFALIVDGLFGIGLQRPVTGAHAALIEMANDSGVPVLAVDVPSGLASDTGRVMGCAVRATRTVTFIGLKPGLLTLDGPDCCGALQVADLGLDAPALLPPRGSVIGSEILREALPPRALNTHKGDYGSLGIIGGAHGMVGAALLAGRAAIKLGTGRVYLGLLAPDAPSVDFVQPELMLRSTGEVLAFDHLTALAAGPGLGQSDAAVAALSSALESPLPLVVDADGLNLIAARNDVRHKLSTRTAPTVLTPHPAEAARLLACPTAEVQQDRLQAANRLAVDFNCGVVLKGAGSVCAWPDDVWSINDSGNPGMASAGMGDVLTGFIGSLLAQGRDPRLALAAGVHLHGAAADTLVAHGRGPAGLTAGELIDAARELINQP